MNEKYKYKAFISYSHRDEKWGRWVHKSIEGYKIPKPLTGKTTLNGIVPKRLFPLFRDREELPTASDLGETIAEALSASSHLIVICSPNSAKSKWVNEEIKSFKKLGKQNRILCLIIDGEPNAGEKPELELKECFPEALKYLADEEGNLTDRKAEPIAADIRPGKDGKANCLLKIVAGLIGVGFDDLKQRDLLRRQRKTTILVSTSIFITCLMGLIASWAFGERTNARKQLYYSKIKTAEQYLSVNDPRSAVESLLDSPEEFRDFEWGYLMRESNPQLLDLDGHSGAINSINFSQDGLKIISASSDNTARVWDAKTGDELLKMSHHTAVLSAMFSRDGEKIITASMDGSIRNWDPSSGLETGIEYEGNHLIKQGNLDPIPREEAVRDLFFHSDAVFSANNEKYLIAENDTIVIKNLALGEVVRLNIKTKHWLDYKQAVFSKDGNFCAIPIGIGSAVSVFDTQTGDEIRGFICGNDGTLHHLSFSPDDKILITSHTLPRPWYEKRPKDIVQIWDIKSGKEIKRITGLIADGEGMVLRQKQLHYSDNGKYFLALTGDNLLKIWETDSWDIIFDFNAGSEDINIAKFLLLGDTFVTGSELGGLKIWSLNNGSSLAPLTDYSEYLDVNVSSDGSQIALAQGGLVMILNARNGVVKSSKLLGGYYPSIAVNSISKLLVGCSHHESNWGVGRVWDTQTMKFQSELNTSSVSPGYAVCVNFSPNGKKVVTGGIDNKIRIFDARLGTELQVINCDLDYNPTDPTAQQSEIDLFKKYGINDFKIVADGFANRKKTIPSETFLAVSSVVFSPDASSILASNLSNVVRLWDSENGNLLFELNGHFGAVFDAKFDSSGERIVTSSADKTARVWSSSNGHELISLKHYNSVLSACFSPDGNRIVTFDDSSSARIWDANLGLLLAHFKSQAPIRSAYFHPDGDRIITLDGYGRLEILFTSPWDLAEYPGDRSTSFSERYNKWNIQRVEEEIADRETNTEFITNIFTNSIENEFIRDTSHENNKAIQDRRSDNISQFEIIKSQEYFPSAMPSSKNSEINVTLAFENKLNVDLSVVWCDYDGQQQPLVKIPPLETILIDTYSTHLFLIKKEDTRDVLGLYQAPSKSAKVVLESTQPLGNKSQEVFSYEVGDSGVSVPDEASKVPSSNGNVDHSTASNSGASGGDGHGGSGKLEEEEKFEKPYQIEDALVNIKSTNASRFLVVSIIIDSGQDDQRRLALYNILKAKDAFVRDMTLEILSEFSIEDLSDEVAAKNKVKIQLKERLSQYITDKKLNYSVLVTKWAIQ